MRSRFMTAVAASLTTLAVGVGVVAATGVGFAGDGGTTINACVKKANGQVRVVDSPAACTAAETAMSWGQQGPQGLPGPAGPAGPTVTFVRRSSAWVDVPSDEWTAVEAWCEAGEVVTGGGYSVGSIGFDDKVHVSGPLTEDGLDGWQIQFHNLSGYMIGVGVTAICAQYPATA